MNHLVSPLISTIQVLSQHTQFAERVGSCVGSCGGSYFGDDQLLLQKLGELFLHANSGKERHVSVAPFLLACDSEIKRNPDCAQFTEYLFQTAEKLAQNDDVKKNGDFHSSFGMEISDFEFEDDKWIEKKIKSYVLDLDTTGQRSLSSALRNYMYPNKEKEKNGKRFRKMSRYPPILMIHLNEIDENDYKEEKSGGMYKKFELLFELDVGKFAFSTQSEDKTCRNYDLCGIIAHGVGDTDDNYFSWIRTKNEWHKLTDKTTDTKIEDFKSQIKLIEEGCIFRPKMIFYCRKDSHFGVAEKFSIFDIHHQTLKIPVVLVDNDQNERHTFLTQPKGQKLTLDSLKTHVGQYDASSNYSFFASKKSEPRNYQRINEEREHLTDDDIIFCCPSDKEVKKIVDNGVPFIQLTVHDKTDNKHEDVIMRECDKLKSIFKILNVNSDGKVCVLRTGGIDEKEYTDEALSKSLQGLGTKDGDCLIMKKVPRRRKNYCIFLNWIVDANSKPVSVTTLSSTDADESAKTVTTSVASFVAIAAGKHSGTQGVYIQDGKIQPDTTQLAQLVSIKDNFMPYLRGLIYYAPIESIVVHYHDKAATGSKNPLYYKNWDTTDILELDVCSTTTILQVKQKIAAYFKMPKVERNNNNIRLNFQSSSTFEWEILSDNAQIGVMSETGRFLVQFLDKPEDAESMIKTKTLVFLHEMNCKFDENNNNNCAARPNDINDNKDCLGTKKEVWIPNKYLTSMVDLKASAAFVGTGLIDNRQDLLSNMELQKLKDGANEWETLQTVVNDHDQKIVIPMVANHSVIRVSVIGGLNQD